MSQPAHRQPRPPAQGDDWGIAIPFFAGIAGVFIVSCWPAIVWHGYTDTGGWRWDIHSTIGCCAWWGILALTAVLFWARHRTGTPRPRRERSWPPPKYVPPRPVPDPAVTMRLLEGLDEIDRYAAEAEKARTGEELDHLIIHGRLPGRERKPS